MAVRHWDISGRRWQDLSLTLHCPLRHGQLLEALEAGRLALEPGLQAAVAAAACRPGACGGGGRRRSGRAAAGGDGGSDASEEEEEEEEEDSEQPGSDGPGQGRQQLLGGAPPRRLGSLDLSRCLPPEALRAAAALASSTLSGSSRGRSQSRSQSEPPGGTGSGSEQPAAQAARGGASPCGLLAVMGAGPRDLADLNLAGLDLSSVCRGTEQLPAALQLVQRLDLTGACGVSPALLQQLLAGCRSLSALHLAGCKSLAAEDGEEGVAAAIHAAQQQLEQQLEQQQEQQQGGGPGEAAPGQEPQWGGLLPHLHELTIGWGWGDRSLGLLAASLQLLVRLEVGVGASLTDAGLGLLAGACQHLQHLSLTLCAVSDAGEPGASMLLHCPRLLCVAPSVR
jgi:hypothetical protein